VFSGAPVLSWRAPAYALVVVALCLAAFGALLLLRHGNQLAVTPSEGTETMQLGVAGEDDSTAVVVNYVLDSIPIDAEFLRRGVPLASQLPQGSVLPKDSMDRRGVLPPSAVKPRLVSF